jgi:hypothetical protein
MLKLNAMKKSIALFAIITLVAGIAAQSPQKMSYQCVVRNLNGALVVNQQVGLQISIIQGTADGTVVFREVFSPNPRTNANGLLNIEVGSGVPVTGTFSSIDWSAGPCFLKTEADPTGATNYTITSTSQLLSVPYALYAKTAENVSSGSAGNDSAGANKFYLGQDTLGGIVYYLYTGSNGRQHGLIVSKTESAAKWQNTAVQVNADRTEDGAYNTGLMKDSPAKDWITSNFSPEWYLPSIDELSILWHNRYHVNKALRAGSYTLLSSTAFYWSSTEYFSTYAFSMLFTFGYSTIYQKSGSSKADPYYVRAIRSF